MEERSILILNKEQIEQILFEYYFSEYDERIKEQILKSLKLNYKITIQYVVTETIKTIKFILKYKIPIDSLDNFVHNEIILSLNDLNNIINEKLSNEEYKVDRAYIDSGFSLSDKRLKCIKYYLKKNEKVKTKKKGWR